MNRSSLSLVDLMILTKSKNHKKSILKNTEQKLKFKKSGQQLRFKDQCKSEHSFLEIFSKDSW